MGLMETVFEAGTISSLSVEGLSFFGEFRMLAMI